MLNITSLLGLVRPRVGGCNLAPFPTNTGSVPFAISHLNVLLKLDKEPLKIR